MQTVQADVRGKPFPLITKLGPRRLHTASQRDTLESTPYIIWWSSAEYPVMIICGHKDMRPPETTKPVHEVNLLEAQSRRYPLADYHPGTNEATIRFVKRPSR
ncbi:MAG: hypothetical protein WCV84_04075 [Patescibacteria group bacterium]